MNIEWLFLYIDLTEKKKGNETNNNILKGKYRH